MFEQLQALAGLLVLVGAYIAVLAVAHWVDDKKLKGTKNAKRD
jgi:uncharacterized membrane protein YidH (DUF202 family)